MPQNQEERKSGTWAAVSFAWELGYSIAFPLVALLLFGKLADTRLETTPWFMLGGIVVSLPVSGFIIWSKVKKFL